MWLIILGWVIIAVVVVLVLCRLFGINDDQDDGPRPPAAFGGAA